ncbi:MAG TPA: formyltransferase family protein [Humisphaera sp.]
MTLRPSHPPRTVLLTSDERRHRYVAARVAQDLAVVGIVAHPKPKPAPAAEPTTADAALLADHFRGRGAAEAAILGDPPPLDATCPDLLRIPAADLNAPATLAWVAARRPDVVLLYGTGIVGNGLLSAFPGRVVNLHLGLSPYYRGAGTNVWPLVRGEPWCVGYTIHLAVPAVDAGPVLVQGRPAVEPADGPHEMGTRTIAAAAAALGPAVRAYLDGARAAVDQPPGGLVFRRRDFTADTVRAMRDRLAGGMVRRYCENREADDRRAPIVT